MGKILSILCQIHG